MPVQRASDARLSDRDKLCQLLARMLDTKVSDTTRKQHAVEFETLMSGRKIDMEWSKELNIEFESGIDQGMGYVDLIVPDEFVPMWYKKNNSGKAKVRFYMSVIGNGPGIGPVVENNSGTNPFVEKDKEA